MRTWKIHIPVKPKCVQSVRFRIGQGGFEPKPVREWKKAVRPFIQAASSGSPSKLPIEILRITYSMKIPQATKKGPREYLAQGGVIPCLKHMDVTDNLNKGLIDVCKGILFEDDSQIWKLGNVSKVWALEDSIDIELRECPDIPLLQGGTGADLEYSNSF